MKQKALAATIAVGLLVAVAPTAEAKKKWDWKVKPLSGTSAWINDIKAQKSEYISQQGTSKVKIKIPRKCGTERYITVKNQGIYHGGTQPNPLVPAGNRSHVWVYPKGKKKGNGQLVYAGSSYYPSPKKWKAGKAVIVRVKTENTNTSIGLWVSAPNCK